MMEDKETMSHPNPSLESDGQCDFSPSGRFEVGSELDGREPVHHQFYFVKLWPTEPDSISQIKKEESVVKKMNQDLCEITEKITEKMSERNHLEYSRLRSFLNYQHREWKNRLAKEGKILNDLYMALDELCFVNNAPKRRSNNACFMGELNNHIRWSPYLKNWEKLLEEIEQFQSQWERAAGNASVKGKISNYKPLKKALKDQIKLFCDDSLQSRKKGIELGASVRHAQKQLEALDQEIYSLRAKMTEKRKKKDEAYQRMLKLKNLYDGEVIHYYQYCSLLNKVHQLAEGKDVAALDELSRSEVGTFMLEWNNNNKVLREDYEKKVLQSLERRQLSRDGRRRLDNHK
ncbi:proton pump-interactor [Sesbania bispinosa]|nr:proton pump-interactor [Sesbania bispinosa]